MRRVNRLRYSFQAAPQGAADMAALGIAAVFGSKNPFGFMELQDVQELTNFFERRVSAYQVAVKGEVAFHDGVARYEHQFNRRSHHHMVCTDCGSSVEFFSPEVDNLEQKIGRQHNYETTRHTFQIYGVCEDCRKKGSNKRLV